MTNGKIIRLLVDDEPLDVRYGQLLTHERELDLRAGALRRRADWRSPAGTAVRVRSTRLVSFVQRSAAAILYEVEPLEGPVRVVVQSELVANEPEPARSKDPRTSGMSRRRRADSYRWQRLKMQESSLGKEEGVSTHTVGRPRDPAYLEQLIPRVRGLGLKSSICGQAPSVYLEYTELLVRAGIDAISVNIDVFDRTRRLIDAAERRLLLGAARDGAEP